MQTGSLTKVGAAVLLLLLGGGCKSGPPKAAVIGEAFAGPATLKIRSDFALRSATVATVTHGERLEILQVRRKFLRVRAPNGAEGWTDERQLRHPVFLGLREDKAAKNVVRDEAVSVKAVTSNLAVMAAWGLIVVVLLAAGAVVFLIGLAAVLPILGHATWHLYRKVIEP